LADSETVDGCWVLVWNCTRWNLSVEEWSCVQEGRDLPQWEPFWWFFSS
jgi:hypothetical protein